MATAENHLTDYTPENPDFSDTIRIPTVLTSNHADNFNEAYKRLIKNDAALKQELEEKDGKITALEARPTFIVTQDNSTPPEGKALWCFFEEV